MFGSRHSCLEFRLRVGVRTLALHVVGVCGLEFAQPHALLSTCVLWCCTQFVFLSAAAFMLYLVLCATQLVYFIGCVLSCCHVLCEHMAYEFSH